MSSPKAYKPLISILFGVALIIAAIWRGIFFESGYPVNYTDPVPTEIYKNILLRESAKEMGVDLHHKRISADGSADEYSNLAIPPAVAVYDVNLDGFQDLIVSGSAHPIIFLNRNGNGFERVDGKFGFDVDRESPASMVVFADLNRDGNADVIVSGHPHQFLYYGERTSGGLKFHPAFDKLSYQSSPEALNVLDFDRDGLLDLVFGNFTAKPGEGDSEVLWLGGSRYDNKTGGANDLLLQSKDGSFSVASYVNFRTRSYTHSAGVSDLDADGWPDIFFANDYARDELFMNRWGRAVIDVTREKLPLEWHGNSGMNGEIVDYNNDGRPDIYVTNVYKPPFYNAVNLLWEQQEDGRFQATSIDNKTAHCGFSWGAKFLDINNDGQLDLAVTNGRNRARNSTEEKKGDSLWYRRALVAQIPKVIRKYYYENQLSSQQFSTSAFERDCLFIQDSGVFHDVAPYAGVVSKYEGRGLAIIDIENDGRLDYVVVNMQGPVEIFHNQSTTTGNWIGVKLVDRNGSDLPIGARIVLTTKAGKKITREFYPANGYRSQSDPRLHFGLGSDQPEKLEVVWPSARRQNFELKTFNQYIEIYEKK